MADVLLLTRAAYRTPRARVDDRRGAHHAGSMLDLYTWRTPNGRKVPILLAELELPHQLHLIDISKKQQKEPAYLAINPNGKIPALVDSDGPGGERVTLFESGAILAYLAEKTGRLLPRAPAARAEVMSWLFWQVGGPGPTFGQLGQFGMETPRNEKAFDKFLDTLGYPCVEETANPVFKMFLQT